MDFKKLAFAADKAIEAIESDLLKYISEGSILSIKNQMWFIQSSAREEIDPRSLLNGRQFTYSLIASREFSSPDELNVKSLLDEVSTILDADSRN